ETAIPYGEIPGARASTVLGHQGRLIFGHTKGLPVVAMQGRVHYYEGYEMSQVMFLSRVIGRLGIKKLVVTNAAGGINTSYMAAGILKQKLTHQEVMDTTERVQSQFTELVLGVLGRLA